MIFFLCNGRLQVIFEDGKIYDYFGSNIYDMPNFHWENVIYVGGNNENSLSLPKHTDIYLDI